MANDNAVASDKTYEDRLGDALEHLLANGADDLAALSAGLNVQGITLPDGRAWTVENLQAELHRLAESA
jgi:hypothetical protein